MALGGGAHIVICMCSQTTDRFQKKLIVQSMNIIMNMFYPIIIKCHTPLNTSNSIKVEINTSHAMCNMSVQQMMGKI